jgi:hypothetical protein
MAFPILAIWLIGCSSGAVREDLDKKTHGSPVGVCAIAAQDSKYDGQKFLIEGTYQHTPEGSVLFQRSCDVFMAYRFADDYKAEDGDLKLADLKKQDNARPIHIVVIGTFLILAVPRCDAAFCYRYKVEVSDVVSARPEK